VVRAESVPASDPPLGGRVRGHFGRHSGVRSKVQAAGGGFARDASQNATENGSPSPEIRLIIRQNFEFPLIGNRKLIVR
jgi:hypothetical protein